MIPGVSALDAAYALLVAAAAWVFPPSALAVAAIFFLASAWLADHRAPEPVE